MNDKFINLFWFRRDLRLEDNNALSQALQKEIPVLPLFIFDSEILDELPKDDPRVTFIHEQLQTIRRKLLAQGSSLALYYGKPEAVFKKLLQEYKVSHVFTNHDYEPYAIKRDLAIQNLLASYNISFLTFKDQVIFEKSEVTKADKTSYLVYTPYMKQWKKQFSAEIHLKKQPVETYFQHFIKNIDLPNLELSEIGFTPASIQIQPYLLTPDLIDKYAATRNFPSLEKGTSHLSPHLRFGTISIRQAVRQAIASKEETFWQELIWREFFMQILWHFPKTVHTAFKPKYDRINWRNNPEEFNTWKQGKTGYALVDAGMRQLNTTGYMHNRVRMLVASFLCKHLLIDWRWGEAYFAEKLLDYEQASNVGNWQWVAGSGVDAAPYFRIFNPDTQLEKFDKQLNYIKKYVPEYGTSAYPKKMVDHKEARERVLEVYKEALG